MQILHSNLKCALSIMDYDWKLMFSVIIFIDKINNFSFIFKTSFLFQTVHFNNTFIFRYSDSVSILPVVGKHQELIEIWEPNIQSENINDVWMKHRFHIKFSHGISTYSPKKTSKVHQSQWCSINHKVESVMQTGCSTKTYWSKSYKYFE